MTRKLSKMAIAALGASAFFAVSSISSDANAQHVRIGSVNGSAFGVRSGLNVGLNHYSRNAYTRNYNNLYGSNYGRNYNRNFYGNRGLNIQVQLPTRYYGHNYRRPINYNTKQLQYFSPQIIRHGGRYDYVPGRYNIQRNGHRRR